MDITSVSGASAFQQNKALTSVGTAVAVKVLDSQRTQGAAALQLLRSATLPTSTSKGVDVRG